MVLALSLSSDVKSIGAYAGFAAIVGLALLVILYFAQARETRRLSDALEEHEARLRRIPPPTAATMPRPVAAVGAATPAAPPRPVAVPPSAVPVSPPTATVAVPGARRVAVTPAATVVAVPDPTAEPEAGDAVTDVRPAQTLAATPPAAEPPEEEVSPTAQTHAVTPEPADPPASAQPPAPEAEPPAEQPQPPPSVLPAATPAGAAAAAAKPDAPAEDEGETTTVRPAAMPLVARPAATAEAPPAATAKRGAFFAPEAEDAAPVAALADPPLPRYPPAPGERAAPVGATARIGGRGDAATATLRRERRPEPEQTGDGEGHHLGSRGTLRLLAVAIVLIGVLIFVANELLSGGSPSHPAANTPQTSSGPAPATVTVAVLNGTASSGLASRVSSTLVSDGFKPGAINNAPSQNLASTTVQYIHSSDIAAANEVAHDLQLTTTQVIRANAATIAAATIAGRVPTVIAVIGKNYAQ